MKARKGFTLIEMLIVYAIIVLPCLIGWTLNVVKLCRCDFKPSYRSEVIRGLGVVVPPIGAITGWMKIKDIVEDKTE